MNDFADGTPVYGSQKVTIAAGPNGGGTGNYVAKNIKVGRYSADRKTTSDEKGNENGQWFTSKIPTGTMTLQFPDSTHAAPGQYSTVGIKPAGSAATVNFIIFDVGETYDVNGETMCDCQIAMKVTATA